LIAVIKNAAIINAHKKARREAGLFKK